jgi:hypothetical protein
MMDCKTILFSEESESTMNATPTNKKKKDKVICSSISSDGK